MWKTDDYFYHAQGMAHVMYHLTQAVRARVRDRPDQPAERSPACCDEVIDALGKAAVMKPLIVLDGSTERPVRQPPPQPRRLHRRGAAEDVLDPRGAGEVGSPSKTCVTGERVTVVCAERAAPVTDHGHPSALPQCLDRAAVVQSRDDLVDVRALAGEEVGHRLGEAGVGQVVQAVRGGGVEAAPVLVVAAGAGLEAREAAARCSARCRRSSRPRSAGSAPPRRQPQ